MYLFTYLLTHDIRPQKPRVLHLVGDVLLVVELQEAFMLFDYGKSGKISVRDIGPVIRSVGLKPSQAEIRSIMTDVQQSGMHSSLSADITLWD